MRPPILKGQRLEKSTPVTEPDMPDHPHLLLYTSTTLDEAIAMRQGTNIGVMVRLNKGEDPMHRLVLMDVKRDRLRFKCMCDPKCTMVYVFKRQTQGTHPPNKWRSVTD